MVPFSFGPGAVSWPHVARLSWRGSLHLFRAGPKMPRGETVSSSSRSHPHRGHREGSSHSVPPLLRRLASGPADDSVDHTSAAFPLRFLGLGFGWLRLKGPPLVVDWLAEFFPHPSQPFILGFQFLILAPELRHLFGNSFLCHARLTGIVARKPNFAQLVSRR
jgi:hypothetical protein